MLKQVQHDIGGFAPPRNDKSVIDWVSKLVPTTAVLFPIFTEMTLLYKNIIIKEI
jgi:hypothetical protein